VIRKRWSAFVTESSANSSKCSFLCHTCVLELAGFNAPKPAHSCCFNNLRTNCCDNQKPPQMHAVLKRCLSFRRRASLDCWQIDAALIAERSFVSTTFENEHLLISAALSAGLVYAWTFMSIRAHTLACVLFSKRIASKRFHYVVLMPTIDD